MITGGSLYEQGLLYIHVTDNTLWASQRTLVNMTRAK